MSKTLVDIDDELLMRAQQILGAKTKKEAVNRALGEIVRRAAAKEFVHLARSGVFGVVADTASYDHHPKAGRA
jgi:Arc/MetJ family transcription regulator